MDYNDKKVSTALKRAALLADFHINCNNLTKNLELFQQAILTDESLNEELKQHAINALNMFCDSRKVFNNKGENRICENCQLECLATLYCEHCVRNYLKAKFSDWASGNDDIDNLIQ